MTIATAVQPTRDLVTYRFAIAAMFFVNGGTFANWAARIPAVQANLGLTELQIGIVLQGMAVGVLSALLVSSGLIARYSSRTVLTWTALTNVATLPLMGLLGSGVLFAEAAAAFGMIAALWGALVLFGMSTSSMDVAMNGQAIEVERRYGKTIMSSFHAAWSLGMVSGAGLGALFGFLQVGVQYHLLIAFLIYGTIALVVAPRLMDAPDKKNTGEPTAIFSLPPRAVWLLGLIAFCSALGEGAMIDWSALYLRNVAGVLEGTAALGLLAFTGFMTVGRLAGDTLVDRFSRVRVVRWGGLLAAAGILLMIVLPTLTAVLIGFGMVGLGLATIVPLAFSVAGNLPDVDTSAAVAGTATIAYTGFLVGPPMLGFLAEISYRGAFAVVMVMLLVMALVAGRALRPAS
jgi:predicted MFS family arabinose efflux permease